MARTSRSSRPQPHPVRSGYLWRLAASGSSTAESVAAVERGLPLSAIAELRSVLREDEVDRLVIPRRTLAHRKLRREPLSIEESDRALRLARVTAFATVDESHVHGWRRMTTRSARDTFAYRPGWGSPPAAEADAIAAIMKHDPA